MKAHVSRNRLVLVSAIAVAVVLMALAFVLSGPRPVHDQGQAPDSAGEWWADYPLCPGENGDRAGYGEAGGNDKWHTGEGDRIPVPHDCVGWIHWARGYWDPGEIPDEDYFYFVPDDTRADIVVTLTWLPADYRLAVYVRPAIVDGVSRQEETLVSSHLGTEDEMVVIPSAFQDLHTIIIRSQLQEGGAVDFDAEHPYLLSVRKQSRGEVQ